MAERAVTRQPHSKDRDHGKMTGGTLENLLVLSSPEGLSLHHYFLPVSDMWIPDLDKGMHTFEHMMAYSEDTGSLRGQVHQLTGDEELATCLIDVSPYKTAEGAYGFRVTSAVPLDTDILTTAYSNSLQRGIDYIKAGGEAPFATARQCGQYDLHRASVARDLMHAAQRRLVSGEQVRDISIPRPTGSIIEVADLRLVRPKADGAHKQRTLRPDASYIISQLMEQFASPDGRLALGTYGCMTGDYMMTIDTPRDQTHVAVARTLIQLTNLRDSHNQAMRWVGEDAAFCLAHIKAASPQIYEQAMDLGALDFDAGDAIGGRHVRRRPATH